MTQRFASFRLHALLIVAAVNMVSAIPRPASAAAVQACSASILSCGCTITSSGYYQVDGTLSSDQGLTSHGECVAIKASNVVLNLAASHITGPGGASASSPTIGVSIAAGSKNNFVEGASAMIEGWTVGVEIQGSQNVLEFFNANGNDVAGIVLRRGSANNISDFVANNNGEFGVWIQQSNNNQLNCSNADNNGNAGIYSGCSQSESQQMGCRRNAASSGNRVFNLMVLNNGAYGIVLDSFTRHSVIADVSARGNPAADLSDQNSGCGTDLWFDNSFDSANQACVN